MGATALTAQRLRENWEKLKGLVAGNLPSREAAVFLHLLDTLKEDQPDGQKHYLGFYRSPAARRNHHAYEGGLVQHLLEMWSLWEQLKPKLNAPPFISDERVFKAIILHDLHNAYRTTSWSSKPSGRVGPGGRCISGNLTARLVAPSSRTRRPRRRPFRPDEPCSRR
jgi:hypothetical protein